jgi:hypothetical protein
MPQLRQKDSASARRMIRQASTCRGEGVRREGSERKIRKASTREGGWGGRGCGDAAVQAEGLGEREVDDRASPHVWKGRERWLRREGDAMGGCGRKLQLGQGR